MSPTKSALQARMYEIKNDINRYAGFYTNTDTNTIEFIYFSDPLYKLRRMFAEALIQLEKSKSTDYKRIQILKDIQTFYDKNGWKGTNTNNAYYFDDATASKMFLDYEDTLNNKNKDNNVNNLNMEIDDTLDSLSKELSEKLAKKLANTLDSLVSATSDPNANADANQNLNQYNDYISFASLSALSGSLAVTSITAPSMSTPTDPVGPTGYYPNGTYYKVRSNPSTEEIIYTLFNKEGVLIKEVTLDPWDTDPYAKISELTKFNAEQERVQPEPKKILSTGLKALEIPRGRKIRIEEY